MTAFFKDETCIILFNFFIWCLPLPYFINMREKYNVFDQRILMQLFYMMISYQPLKLDLLTLHYSREREEKLIFANLICRNISRMHLIQIWVALLLLSFGNLIFCGSITIQLCQRWLLASQAWTVLKPKYISPLLLPNRHSKTCRWNRSLLTHNLTPEKLTRGNELPNRPSLPLLIRAAPSTKTKWRRNFQQDSVFSGTSRTTRD